VGVSAVCLYLATRGVDWGEVGGVLAGARWHWVAAVMLASLASHAIRAQRWRILLRPVVRAPYGPAFSATLIGFGASMVFPLRLGEIVRPALLGRRVGIGLAPALSSVVVERLLDMLFVILCFVLLALTYEQLEPYRGAAWTAATVLVAGTASLMILARRRRVADRLVEAVLRIMPTGLRAALRSLAGSLLDGIGGMAHGPTLLAVLGYSAVLWAFILSTYLFAFWALAIDVPLLSASLAAVVIVAFFVSIPQAPGFVGTWQAGCVLALGLFGVPQEISVGYSFLTWIIQMVVNIGAAGTCVAFEDVSVRQLLSMGRERA
jgi:uncharacterized protein (TIRG00374 family)